jgi:hypothetical protein
MNPTPNFTDEPTLNSCLIGTLDTWPLSDLLVWLHQTQRTAMVRIGAGLDAGVLFYREGNLVRCDWRGRHGEEALLALLAEAEGSFTLIQRALPDVRANIRRSTPELLLQCSLALDEYRRASGA